jgi:glycerol-3-phosphate dehydrogenase (NAD(P)+)
MADIAVLGAGAFGTALAIHLARVGHWVVLCTRRHSHLEEMEGAGENAAYLPGIPLARGLELSDRWADALATAKVIVMAVPSRFARSSIAPVVTAIPPEAILISVTKGIEEDTLLTMSRMLGEVVGRNHGIAVLSGPGFAAELAQGLPAALVAAAAEVQTARQVQELFAARRLRVYRSRDVIGVELGGVVKNVIAIAAGISDGLELGHSARAGLITRGIAEITRLGRAMGAESETIAGLAGMGDLVLTCTGALSRNRRLGLALARGERAPEPSDGTPIAEGATNAAAIHKLARRLGVEMPIVAAVHRVLYEGGRASAMVEELLSRELKAEFEKDTSLEILDGKDRNLQSERL